MPQPRWHWRHCRSLQISLHISLWPIFIFQAERIEDVYGGEMRAAIGPFAIGIRYDHGNASDPGINGWFALSETQVWDRSCWLEGIQPEGWH